MIDIEGVINNIILQCQTAALDELFGNPASCFQRYHTAQILLHSLSQHIQGHEDRDLLFKCKSLFQQKLASFHIVFICLISLMIKQIKLAKKLDVEESCIEIIYAL